MTHLGLEVCLAWACMSVLVSDLDFLREDVRWLNGDRSSVRFAFGISGIVKGSDASSERCARLILRVSADAGGSRYDGTRSGRFRFIMLVRLIRTLAH
jgi:hypothetical protein